LNWPEPTEQRQAIENSFDIASAGANTPGTIFPKRRTDDFISANSPTFGLPKTTGQF
jgi:hypothetical protein